MKKTNNTPEEEAKRLIENMTRECRFCLWCTITGHCAAPIPEAYGENNLPEYPRVEPRWGKTCAMWLPQNITQNLQWGDVFAHKTLRSFLIREIAKAKTESTKANSFLAEKEKIQKRFGFDPTTIGVEYYDWCILEEHHFRSNSFPCQKPKKYTSSPQYDLFPKNVYPGYLMILTKDGMEDGIFKTRDIDAMSRPNFVCCKFGPSSMWLCYYFHPLQKGLEK